MRTLRLRLLVLLVLAALQGCEDDPILEPTPDQTGGGSYGNLAPLSGRSGAPNPRAF